MYEEQAEGVRRREAQGVWNQARSLAQTTSHSGRREAPRPSAGPFTATTMGFRKWMKARTKSLHGEATRTLNCGGLAVCIYIYTCLYIPYVCVLYIQYIMCMCGVFAYVYVCVFCVCV